MKLDKRDVANALDRPSPNIRFYLFHGPDESQSRAHAERLLAGLDAERSVVTSGALKSDPALLTDEAGAIGLFGGKRAIWVEPAADEIAEAVESLLEGPPGESPVIVIAGTLRKNGRLLSIADKHRDALVLISYQPDDRDAARIVIALGREHGLTMRGDVAARLATACRNDRAVAARELEKLACYLDADPERPKELDHGAIEAVGADMGETHAGRLADLALAGENAQLASELGQMQGGIDAIPVIRALQRRVLQVAPARARVENGERPHAVIASMGKSLFWKDKELIENVLKRWNSRTLAKVAKRVGELERSLLAKGPPPAGEALGEALLAIAREGARRR